MKRISRISIVSLAAVIVCLSLLICPCTASAQSNPTAFEEAIHEDVVAVASVDLKKIKLLEFGKWAAKVGLVPKEELLAAAFHGTIDAEELKLIVARFQGAIDTLAGSSVERISVLYRLSDLGAYSPMWVATISKGGDVAQATEALRETVDIFQLDKRAMQARDGLIFGGPSTAAIDSLFAESDSAERDLSEAIKTLHQHTAGIIVFGNQDTRRVVREMLPSLPKPFSEATRELIADHTDWGGLFMDLPPTTDLKLIFQASDNESAQTIGRLSTATIEYALRKSPPKINEAIGKTILSNVTPQVTERRVVLDAQKVLTGQAFLQSLVAMFKNPADQE